MYKQMRAEDKQLIDCKVFIEECMMRANTQYRGPKHVPHNLSARIEHFREEYALEIASSQSHFFSEDPTHFNHPDQIK